MKRSGQESVAGSSGILIDETPGLFSDQSDHLNELIIDCNGRCDQTMLQRQCACLTT